MITSPTTDIPAPTTLTGVMVIAVVALAGVIVFLFKFYTGRLSTLEETSDKRAAEYAREREAWAIERTKLELARDTAEDKFRSEYEVKHRVIVEKYAQDTRAINEASREHEDAQRREYFANAEIVAARADETQAKVGALLDKALGRLVGSRRT